MQILSLIEKYFDRLEFASPEVFILTYVTLLIASTSLAVLFRLTTKRTYHIPIFVNEKILKLETDFEDLPPFRMGMGMNDEPETVTQKDNKE